MGRKVAKERILTDSCPTAQASVGLPAEKNSEAVAMLRFVLRQLVTLCQLRDTIEKPIHFWKIMLTIHRMPKRKSWLRAILANADFMVASERMLPAQRRFCS